MVHKKRIYTCQIPQPLQNEETTHKPKNWKVIYHALHFQRLLKLKLKVDTSI